MAMQSDSDVRDKQNASISDEMLDTLLGSVPPIKRQEDLFGKDGLLKNITKRLMERLLEAEMTNHLGYMKHSIEGNNTGNSRNGKTAKTGNGEVQIAVPRDRTSEWLSPLLCC